MSTPNLAIPHVAAAQAQKEVTINDGFNRLDRAVTDFLTVNLSAGNVTLTADQFRLHRIFRSQGVTVPRTLTVPQIRREASIDNADGTADLTVARGTGSVVVPAGAALTVYTDGTADGIRAIGGVGGGGASEFVDLTDTPSSYAGQSLRSVRVNAAETGLEFFAPTVFASNWAVPFRGALTQKTATQSVPANTETTITFNNTIYDTDSFWSNANPSRLTVPAGVTRVIVSANVRITGGSTSAQLQLRMNGGDVVGVANVNMSTGFTVAQINAVSAPISVTAGDYFEASVFVTAARTIDSSARTWLAIQVVEVSTAEQAPSISGARGLNAWGGTAGGTADARTISLTPALTAYFAGLTVCFVNGAAANTGAATLNVDGLGAVAIRKGDGSVDLDPGDLPASALVTVVHDGTVFRLA
jgi:hypothetical protein